MRRRVASIPELDNIKLQDTISQNCVMFRVLLLDVRRRGVQFSPLDFNALHRPMDFGARRDALQMATKLAWHAQCMTI